MIAFDSNILIYALQPASPFHSQALGVFMDISEKLGVCSTLVITESYYNDITRADQLTPLLSSSIQVLPVSKDIAEAAGKLRVQHNLKNIDAIHFATAIAAKADVFITNDLTLLKKHIPGLVIRGL